MKYVIALLLAYTSMLAEAQINPRYFSYERTPCFGKCPEYKVEVLSNGKITYVGIKNVERLGSFEATLSPKQRKAILSSFVKYKLPLKSNKYKKIATDLPSLNYWYEIKKKRYTQINVNQGPKKLDLIAAVVDSMLPKLKWVMTFPRQSDLNEDELQIAEPPPPPPISSERIYSIVEQMPQFPGGETAMFEFIRKNLKYPQAAAENGDEGRVIVGFTVDNQGGIYDVKIQRGVTRPLDEEAIRIVKAMPTWIPAKQGGKAVSCKYNLPISFNLEN